MPVISETCHPCPHEKKTVIFCFNSQETFTPAKYFSIDRVFRNETLDATHLAEFHQIEGVVADYNLTLGDLIGVLYEFFKKLGTVCMSLQLWLLVTVVTG